MSRKLPALTLKVFAALHCFLGGAGLLASPLSIRMVGAVASAYERLGVGRLTLQWLKLSTFLSPVTSLVLIVLGLGLWQQRSWARPGAVRYAWLAIVLALMAPLSLAVGTYHGLAMGSSTIIHSLMASLLAAVVGSIFPISTILFLRRLKNEGKSMVSPDPFQEDIWENLENQAVNPAVSESYLNPKNTRQRRLRRGVAAHR